MMNYYEDKKKRNLIFTEHNLDDHLPYNAYHRDGRHLLPVEQPQGPSYWSHLSGRYRSQKEQEEFMKNGCVDKKLPKIVPLEDEDE